MAGVGAGAGADPATVPLDLPERTGVVAARFAPSGELVVVVTTASPVGDRPPVVTVVTCVLGTGVCEEVLADVPPVVLAR